MASKWAIVESSFSGFVGAAVVPFLIRQIASGSLFDSDDEVEDGQLALDPIFILFIFTFLIPNETSLCWCSMSMMVRGTNSIGSHIWRSSTTLFDPPRMVLLITLMLAGFAPVTNSVRNILSTCGCVIGLGILFCNLGARSWKKLNLGYLDSTNVLSQSAVVFASFFTGLVCPYIAINSVHGGTDQRDEAADVEKMIFNPNGKRARQNITLAACAVAIIFLLSDIVHVQDALGFHFSHNRGVVILVVGLWWVLTASVSLALCHRLDSSRAKKIEPFLKRDERSPVGFIVPSIPNIVIDPNLSTSKMFFPFLSYGSDLICAIVILLFAALMVWMGFRGISGNTINSFWDF